MVAVASPSEFKRVSSLVGVENSAGSLGISDYRQSHVSVNTVPSRYSRFKLDFVRESEKLFRSPSRAS